MIRLIDRIGARTIATFWKVDLSSNMFLLSIPVSHEAKVPLLCSKNKRVCRNRESTNSSLRYVYMHTLVYGRIDFMYLGTR